MVARYTGKTRTVRRYKGAATTPPPVTTEPPPGTTAYQGHGLPAPRYGIAPNDPRYRPTPGVTYNYIAPPAVATGQGTLPTNYYTDESRFVTQPVYSGYQQNMRNRPPGTSQPPSVTYTPASINPPNAGYNVPPPYLSLPQLYGMTGNTLPGLFDLFGSRNVGPWGAGYTGPTIPPAQSISGYSQNIRNRPQYQPPKFSTQQPANDWSTWGAPTPTTEGVLPSPNTAPTTTPTGGGGGSGSGGYYGGGGGGSYTYPNTPFAAYRQGYAMRGANAPSTPQLRTAGQQQAPNQYNNSPYAARWVQLLTSWRI
jgi:hypothetical protein